jgi:hypothetical protein
LFTAVCDLSFRAVRAFFPSQPQKSTKTALSALLSLSWYPRPKGALEPLTASQALFHRLLWIFSLCPDGFCGIMALSYDRVVLRAFCACRALPPAHPKRKEVMK